MIGVAFVDNFSIRGLPGADAQAPEVFNERYEAYRDPEGKVLNLRFRSAASTTDQVHIAVWSIDFSDGV